MLGKIKTWARPSRAFLALSVIVLALLAFLLWHLGTAAAHLSAAEAAARSSSTQPHDLLKNAVNAPFRLLQHGLYAFHSCPFFLRLPAVIFAVLTAVSLYRLMVSLFGRIIGLFGALFFISLPLFALSGRQATPAVMLFLPAIIMYLAHRFTKDEKPGFSWLLLMIAAGLALYTPGFIWWLAGAAILSYRKLSAALEDLQLPPRVSGIGLFCLIIIPLIVVSALHPSTLKPLLALPASWPAPLSFLDHTARMAAALFLRNTESGSILLGGQAVLNVTLLALVIFGAYALLTAARNKAQALISAVLLAIILAGLNNDISYLALGVPALMIMAAGGLRYLYIEWRSIFPRNPVPKTFALVLIALVTASQLYFAGTYVLLAWPHSPQTHSRYVVK
jgi:4-amino-4-deoxy-L-arabinose transferase-like glycosyltransferase